MTELPLEVSVEEEANESYCQKSRRAGFAIRTFNEPLEIGEIITPRNTIRTDGVTFPFRVVRIATEKEFAAWRSLTGPMESDSECIYRYIVKAVD